MNRNKTSLIILMHAIYTSFFYTFEIYFSIENKIEGKNKNLLW